MAACTTAVSTVQGTEKTDIYLRTESYDNFL